MAYTEYMPVYYNTFTADFLFWLRGHIHVHSYVTVWVHTICNCFIPACARPARWPACTHRLRRARLNLKAAHLLQKQDTVGQKQISSFLYLPPSESGSPVAASFSAAEDWEEPPAALAAPASGSELDSDVVWATDLHLNVVACDGSEGCTGGRAGPTGAQWGPWHSVLWWTLNTLATRNLCAAASQSQFCCKTDLKISNVQA